MNEVEKMYRNVGIKPLCQIPDKYCGLKNVYEDFTAEKQLELIKWLIKYDELHADFNDNEYGFSSLNYSGNYKKDFAEALASVINYEIWQDLTDAEKAQIKEILSE